MKILLLANNLSAYSVMRLTETATSRGHELQAADVAGCTLLLADGSPQVAIAGQPAAGFDAVVSRISASSSTYGYTVVRQFEMQDIACINGSLAMMRSRDKLRALQILIRKGIGMPRTAVADDPSEVDRLLASVGSPPYVIKVVEGSKGLGVVKADSKSAARSVIEALQGLNAKILVQEFIAEASGSDVRCFVVGDKVVASMRRQGADDDFRSNLHRGGSATAYKLTREERDVATRAARAMGLSVAGVDLLQSRRGPLVMEVNSSPGLEGIEGATGTDVASKILAHVEKVAPKGHRGDLSKKH